jgi:hypothetical protein
MVSVPPPPADCTAVVESPARKNAGGFALSFAGALETQDTSVANVAKRDPNNILKPENIIVFQRENWLETVNIVVVASWPFDISRDDRPDAEICEFPPMVVGRLTCVASSGGKNTSIGNQAVAGNEAVGAVLAYKHMKGYCGVYNLYVPVSRQVEREPPAAL